MLLSLSKWQYDPIIHFVNFVKNTIKNCVAINYRFQLHLKKLVNVMMQWYHCLYSLIQSTLVRVQLRLRWSFYPFFTITEETVTNFSCHILINKGLKWVNTQLRLLRKFIVPPKTTSICDAFLWVCYLVITFRFLNITISAKFCFFEEYILMNIKINLVMKFL